MTSDLDLAVAKRFAHEVTAAQQRGQRRSWRKVTTILDAFRVGRLTSEARRRIEAALRDAGLEVEPSFQAVSRADSVRLRPRIEVTPPQSLTAVAAGVKVSEWHPDGQVRQLNASTAPSPGTIVWYDVDADSEPSSVFELLAPRLPELTQEMVDDLLTADVQPKVATFGDDSTVRAVSFIGVEAAEGAESGRLDTGSKSGELTFQLVETLVGATWMISCWQHSRTCTGATPDREGAPIMRDKSYAHLRARWKSAPGATAGDLGLMLTGHMADTYRVAHRITESWLESWELEFYRSLEATETTTLNNLLSLVNEFRRRLAAFNNARHVTQDQNWFPHVSQLHAEQLDDVLDRALQNLGKLFIALRADVDLVTMNGISAQARASAEQATALARTTDLAVQQRDVSQRLKRELERVAALLLAPGLIAAVFGANTALPGEQTWAGFWIMVLLMVSSGAVVYGFLRFRDRTWAERSPENVGTSPLGSVRDVDHGNHLYEQ